MPIACQMKFRILTLDKGALVNDRPVMPSAEVAA